MIVTYHQTDQESRPKRGDLLQSNIGHKLERTWFIVKTHNLPAGAGAWTQRTKIWCERWWDIEPALRMALYASAERAGGQRVHQFFRWSRRVRNMACRPYPEEPGGRLNRLL